jgi:hypothetical protein
MDEELLELDKKEDAIMQKLTERLTDLGQSILYQELTRILKAKQTIYIQQLEKLKNGH